MIYSGSVSDVPEYFASLGHPFPDHISPPDFLIVLTANDYRSPEAEAESVARIESLTASWRENEPHFLSLQEGKVPLRATISSASATAESDFTEDIHGGAAKPTLWRQVSVLTRRTFKTTYRDTMGLSGCLLEAVVVGFLAGCVFYQMDGSLSGIRSRQAALYVQPVSKGTW